MDFQNPGEPLPEDAIRAFFVELDLLKPEKIHRGQMCGSCAGLRQWRAYIWSSLQGVDDEGFAKRFLHMLRSCPDCGATFDEVREEWSKQ